MQDGGEPCRPDDDMLDGDLGDGMHTGAVPSSLLKKTPSLAAPLEKSLLRYEMAPDRQHTKGGWTPSLKILQAQHAARWKTPDLDSLGDCSKDKLKEKLQEAAEVIDALCCELEVTHRYLEGKYQALKILQGKAILDKATSHTKSLLQKSEEKAKALEKEVNSLQWEISFLQLKSNKSEQTWERKYNRTVSENKTLTGRLDETQKQIQQLGAENSALKRQYLELFSLLNVRDQRIYQGTKPQYSPESGACVLELAVLGACRCFSNAETCPCSRTAAASRKQLVQLQQELDVQRARMEEAVMVADAFRIAFEQQLRKRSEQFLLLAEAKVLKSHHSKPEGFTGSPLISVGQKLRGFLPSSLDIKIPKELLETLYRLLDLLNDKEEALAHQRKVSIMLAHSADELQKQLQLDEPSDSPEPSEMFKKLSDQSKAQSQEMCDVTTDLNNQTDLKTYLDTSFETQCKREAEEEPGTETVMESRRLFRTESLTMSDSSLTDCVNHEKHENHNSENLLRDHPES